MDIQALKATIDPLFKNLPSTGPTDSIKATFLDAYNQVTANFPHVGLSEADQQAAGEIIQKSAQFLTREQINDLHTRVHNSINAMPRTALVGYCAALCGTITALTPDMRKCLPALSLDPKKVYPLAVTRYQWHLTNRQ